MQPMELRHLRYFVAVAEELSFTRAAERLHLAQPSLTRQIRDLEEEIGVRLVDRSGKRICLTEEGKSFLADTKRLLADCAENVEAVQRMSRGKTEQLNIGYVANIYHDLLPAALGAFRKACPNTALNLFDMTPAEQTRPWTNAESISALSACGRARSKDIATCRGLRLRKTELWRSSQRKIPSPEGRISTSRSWSRSSLLGCREDLSWRA